MPRVQFAGPLFAAALLTACADPYKPADVSGGPLPPSSLSKAGSASGAMVVRGTAFFLYVIFDAQAGMAVVLNGRDGIAGCGEAFTLSRPGEFQDVISPQDELLIQELFKADGAFVHLYSWNGVFPPDDDAFCALVTGPRIARGRARLVYTDNDLLAFLRDPVRANSFGLSGNGVVGLTGGGTARFNTLSRIVGIPPQTAGQEFRVNETARIGLTPTK
jgi:hypothetical protein